MEWQYALILFSISFVILMASGLPVFLCFGFINLIGVYFLWGGDAGLCHLILSTYESISRFTLLPVPLFILMGEVMFHSGIAPNMMNALDKWIGRLPGRLSFLAISAGALFAALSGSSLATTGMLGSVLIPDMEKRGYSKEMSLGPIMAGGNLAIIIPPSLMAVLLGALGEFSIGRLLIAIIIPGLVLAALLALYVLVRCYLQPSLAPPYEQPPASFSEKMTATVRYVLPVGFIVFLVVGLIFLGVATPSEAAATGAMGTFILSAVYKKLNWKTIKNAVLGTARVTIMIFMIMVGSYAFSQILSFSGATRGLVNLATGLQVSPIFILIAMQIVLIILGMLMDVVSIMMVTVPMFMRIVSNLGFDPVWFGVIYLLNLEVASVSPPFGMLLFVIKGVAPSGTTMVDVYKSSFPFLMCELLAMVLMIAFPQLSLWLPGLM